MGGVLSNKDAPSVGVLSSWQWKYLLGCHPKPVSLPGASGTTQPQKAGSTQTFRLLLWSFCYPQWAFLWLIYSIDASRTRVSRVFGKRYHLWEKWYSHDLNQGSIGFSVIISSIFLKHQLKKLGNESSQQSQRWGFFCFVFLQVSIWTKIRSV